MSVEDAMKTIASMGPMPLWPSVKPTVGAFMPLQLARKEDIFRHPPREYSYGTLSRQKLDVYLPSSASKAPVFVFLYGGALIQGNKRNNEVVYSNVGSFFAEQGFVTVIIDYRLYGATEDPASFPSGAEDISLALQWLAKGQIAEADTSNLFILGNSAGGVHLATFLWAGSDVSFERHGAIAGLRLAGAILLSAPYSWSNKVLSEPSSVHRIGYYGSVENVIKNSPHALRKRSNDSTPYLVAWDEYDPVEDIRSSIEEFLKASEKDELNGPKPSTYEVKGHNHFSPVYAVGLGGIADQWGRDTVQWIRSIMEEGYEKVTSASA